MSGAGVGAGVKAGAGAGAREGALFYSIILPCKFTIFEVFATIFWVLLITLY